MFDKSRNALLGTLVVVALSVGGGAANAVPIFANALVSSQNVTAFGSGNVTGAPDGGGLFLGSTFDPPAQLGTFTVSFATPLGDGVGVDLIIHEIVSSANETFSVEVSSDNIAFTLIGQFSATNNTVDFGGSFAGPVNFTRLTNTSQLVSADIDALEGNFAFQVPEPSTLAIFGLGLVGLGFFMRRRRILN